MKAIIALTVLIIAAIATAEEPRYLNTVTLAGQAWEVLEVLAERRRSVTHVFEQIEATEEAMLRLWVLRLGEDERRLDPETVPLDVHPLKIEGVGRYAIQIEWSDGHSWGIYTFPRLREMG